MKQFLTLLFSLCLATVVSGQNGTEATRLYRVAEEHFENKQYNKALASLNLSELAFGKITTDVTYLKVMVCYDAVTSLVPDEKAMLICLWLEPLEAAIGSFETLAERDEPYNFDTLTMVPKSNLSTVKRVKAEMQELKNKYNTSEIQYEIAKAYKLGLAGFTKDEETYSDWLLRAAQNGNLTAQYEVATNYKFGLAGFKKDQDLYVKILMFTAEKGYTQAQFDLGNNYAEGNHGFGKDFTKSVEWYIKAAEKNNTYAMWELAHYYQTREELPKDYKKAAEWYKKLLEVVMKQENEIRQFEALSDLGKLYYLPENRQTELAIDYYEKAIAISARNSADRVTLANIYYTDAKVKNYVKATQYLEEVFARQTSFMEEIMKSDRNQDVKNMYVEEHDQLIARIVDQLIGMYSTGGYGLKKNNEKVQFWQDVKNNINR